MDREAGSGITIDLAANGATSVAVTPQSGAIVPVQFTLPTPKFDARGNYVRAKGIITHVIGTFDQAASGGSVVNWDQLPVVVDSFNSNIPLLGVYHEQACYQGPIAKHVIEFLSLGYAYIDSGRAQIASTDGDTTVDLYWWAPFGNEAYQSPMEFCPWVGWLTNMQWTVNIASSTAVAQWSTGAVMKTPFTVKAYICGVPTTNLQFFTPSQWRLYNVPAAGSNQAVLQNVGQQGGLTCVYAGSRLSTIAEMMNVNAMGGATGANAYTSFSMDELAQPITQNPDSFVLYYRGMMKGHPAPISGLGATIEHPAAGNPYTLAATPNAVMDANLMFIPWRTPGKLAYIKKQPKFQGNLTAYRTFTTTPSSGNFPFVTNELRQLTPDAVAQLGQLAGLTPDQYAGIGIDYADGVPTKSAFALPRNVPPRK